MPVDVVIWNVWIVAGPAPVLGVGIPVTGVAIVGVETEGDAATTGVVEDFLQWLVKHGIKITHRFLA